jgi:hypothetical protein
MTVICFLITYYWLNVTFSLLFCIYRDQIYIIWIMWTWIFRSSKYTLVTASSRSSVIYFCLSNILGSQSTHSSNNNNNQGQYYRPNYHSTHSIYSSKPSFDISSISSWLSSALSTLFMFGVLITIVICMWYCSGSSDSSGFGFNGNAAPGGGGGGGPGTYNNNNNAQPGFIP